MKKGVRFLAILLVIAMALSLVGCDSADYKKAIEQYQNGNYEAALAGFEALGDYKRSRDLAKKCEEQLALIGSNGGSKDTVPGEKDPGSFWGSKEQTATDSVVGQWRSDDIDCTEFFLSGLYDSLTAESEEVLDYFDFDCFEMAIFLTFSEDGTVVETVDMDSFMRSVDRLGDALYDAFVAYMENTFTEMAEGEGLTYQDILDYYEVDNIEELCREAADIDLDDFIKTTVKDPCEEMAKELEEKGTYTFENNKVYFYLDSGNDLGELDPVTGTLVLNGDGADGDLKGLYPITFYRVY